MCRDKGAQAERNARLGVVYLARKANPPHFLHAFLSSLRRHPAGCRFDLLPIVKGYEGAMPALDVSGIEGLNAITPFAVGDETFATNTFFMLARAMPHERLLFFVSWGRVLAPGWGAMMMKAMDEDRAIGLLGGSAGWEPLSAETPFPNANIRTTGFMVDRELFLSLEPESLARKYDGNLFEAGPHSMTRRVEALGLKARVIGRDGRLFARDEWPQSGTFRSMDQENLLFADNRTRDYAVARTAKRKRLARLNYGDAAVVSAVNPLTRLWRRLQWRFGA